MSFDSQLQGLHVLLTRPSNQVSSLVAAVTQCGGKVCQMPLIEIEVVSDVKKLQIIKNRLLNLDRYELAIFISTNAATLGIQWIEKYWPQLPVGLSAFAVGPSTAALLEKLDWSVYCPTNGVTSEDLLVLPQLQQIAGKKVALFRGEGGRELIAQTLRGRGAEVDYVELYKRIDPQYSREYFSAQLAQQAVNLIVITSMQMLDALVSLVGDNKELVCLIPLFVPSSRVLECAQQAGFNQVLNMDGANDEAILQSLKKYQECGI